MRKVLALLLLLALPPLLAAGETAAPDGFSMAFVNDLLALHYNPETGAIVLQDRSGDKLWHSNPGGTDSRARGVHRQTLLSQITVTYQNERGTELSLTSAADAVNGGGLTMEIIGDELRAAYDFAKPRLRVRVYYALGPDYLRVRVPVEEIEAYPLEDGSRNLSGVTAVDVLPVFGAGGAAEEGWLLVPDGSGALVHFNNKVTSMVEYNASIYGKDHGVEGQIGLSDTLSLQARTREETARLPVFGVYNKTAAAALLGVVTGNDAKAAVLARVSNLTSYNYVWSRFRVRNGGTMMMNSKEFGASVIGVSERDGLTHGDYEVRYYPLSGDSASAAGMAAKYREYLENEMGLTRRVNEGEYPLYLELYGQVKKPAQFLGVPYTKAVTLTTLADIGEITASLDIPQAVVRWEGWMPGASFEYIPHEAKPAAALGSSRNMAELDQKLRETGGALFPAADLLNVYKGGYGFWPIRDAVLSPVNAPQLQFQPSWASRAADLNVPPWYLLSPAKYAHFFGRYFDSYKNLGLPGLALSAIADVTTSDNRSGGTGRGDVPGIVRDILLDADVELMLSGGNAYAAALARHLLDTPAGASGYTLADEEIPFYQMVFHGFIHYGIGPVNHAADTRAFLLRCLEYGASAQYALVGRSAMEVADSRLSGLFSPDWRAWEGEIEEGYAMLASVLGAVSTLPITGHENLPGGAVTVYGGATAVYVNYSERDMALDGFVVPAMGYFVREAADAGD